MGSQAAALLPPVPLHIPPTCTEATKGKKKKKVLAAASFAKSMSWFLHIRREKNRYLAFTCSNGILIWLLASGSCQLVRTIGVCIFQLSRRSDKGLLLGVSTGQHRGCKGEHCGHFWCSPCAGTLPSWHSVWQGKSRGDSRADALLICCFSSLSTSLGDVLSCQRCEEEMEQLR